MHKHQQSIISILSQTISYRDSYTVQHSGRVAIIATYIGKHLGLTNDDIMGLRFSSLVHDLGKIAVPLEILYKVTPLTNLEYEMIKQHPQTGYDILSKMQWDWPVAEVALQHHERLDGSGYPFGLTSDQILLETKIIAVADLVDSMVNHRPYRVLPPIKQTHDIINDAAGILYDKELCEIAKLYIQENGYIPYTTEHNHN